MTKLRWFSKLLKNKQTKKKTARGREREQVARDQHVSPSKLFAFSRVSLKVL